MRRAGARRSGVSMKPVAVHKLPLDLCDESRSKESLCGHGPCSRSVITAHPVEGEAEQGEPV